MLNSSVLITGANGFLGSALAVRCVEIGARTFGIVRPESDLRRLRVIQNRIGLFSLDEGIDSIFERARPDIVIHTACDYGRLGSSAMTLLQSNVMFGVELIQAAIKFGAGRFMNAGTHLPRNVSAYALSKAQFSEWLTHFATGIAVVDLKIEHFFGPGDNNTKFIRWCLERMVSDDGSIPLTSGEQLRDFVFIDDVVNAFVSCSSYPFEEKYTTVDVGSGHLVRVKDLVLLLKICLEKSLERPIQPAINFGEIPLRDHEVLVPALDLSTLQRTGWRARTTLEQGIIVTVKSFLEERGQ